MYKLLLLDDEEIVTKSIQKVFHLADYDFEVAGAFQNPVKALESLETLQPDLIITDIKMPQMDGLEFTARARKILPDAQIVILSGYDDFTYAQTAVKLGISDYLLKPIKKEDFKTMLADMQEKIQKKQAEQTYVNYLKDFVETNYAELKSRFFLNLAENNSFDETRYRVLQQQMGKDFLEQLYVLVKIDILQVSEGDDYVAAVGKMIQQAQEELSAYGKVEEFLSDESVFFFVYDIREEDEEDIRISSVSFVEAMLQNGMQVSVEYSNLHKGKDEFFLARNDCIRRMFMKELHIDETSDANPVRKPEVNLNIPYTEIEHLFRAISAGDEAQMEQALDTIYEIPSRGMKLLYRDYGYSITFLILLRMCQMQNKYGAAQTIVPQELLELKHLHQIYPDVDMQKEMVGNYAKQLSLLVAGTGNQTPSKTILQALEYITEHFSENISLTDVAENINISKNYLCDIFKKELGVTFINYVTNLRMEKAKEYLAKTDMKMYEISSAVGYNDYAYFSQIFKKFTGMTLSAYRRQN